MADDLNMFHAGVTGTMAAVVTFFGFIGRRFITKVDTTAAALEAHKLEDVGKYATNESLVRVHSRIDDFDKKMEDGFREMRGHFQTMNSYLMNGNHK